MQRGDIDVIAPGFAADCTPEEIAIRYASLYRSHGGGELRYIPALNDSPGHIKALASLLRRHLRGWAPGRVSLEGGCGLEFRPLIRGTDLNWSFHVLDYLLQYGLFLAEVTTVVIAIGVVIRFLFKTIRHAREYTAEHLEVKNLNRRFEQMADVLNHDLLNPYERKAHIKAKKKEYKRRMKEQKRGKTARSRVFVLDFDGDIRASAGEHLREEISAVVQVARPEDEVLLRLESQGGMVHTYGLAASQLRRLKSAGIRLTASVDEVAASGGYMMACVAALLYPLATEGDQALFPLKDVDATLQQLADVKPIHQLPLIPADVLKKPLDTWFGLSPACLKSDQIAKRANRPSPHGICEPPLKHYAMQIVFDIGIQICHHIFVPVGINLKEKDIL